MGKVVARELLKGGHDVIGYDGAAGCDLSSRLALASTLGGGFDIGVCCLPGDLGFQAAQVACELGLPYVDLSFMPEDAVAKLRPNAPLVVDAGLCPGLSNLVVGKYGQGVREVDIFVGGVAPTSDYGFHGYATTWSVDDLLEEYKRPARVLRDWTQSKLEPMDPDNWFSVDVPEVGRMEAFPSDGLRSLLTGRRAADMTEYTLRWPGHMKAIAPHVANGTLKDVLPAGTMDLVVMMVVVNGTQRAWLIDRGDAWHTAMQRTTAFTCAATVEFLAMAGVHDWEAKVYGLEDLATPNGMAFYQTYLGSRGVQLQLT